MTNCCMCGLPVDAHSPGKERNCLIKISKLLDKIQDNQNIILEGTWHYSLRHPESKTKGDKTL